VTIAIVQPGQKLASLASVPGDFADWVVAGLDDHDGHGS